MNNNEEEAKKTVGVRLHKDDVMAIDLLCNRLDKRISPTMRLIVGAGIKELERQHSGQRKKVPHREVSEKKDPRMLAHMRNMAGNELILMNLFRMRKDENITLKELLEDGYIFGCQASETVKKEEVTVGFMLREIHNFRTVWIFNHGLEELKSGLYKVLERD